jgi:hypothetical protein
MCTLLFDYRWPARGHERTREAAMGAFAQSWRRRNAPAYRASKSYNAAK